MADDSHSLLHYVALTLVPNIGSVTAQSLIAYCGSAEAVFRTSRSKLMLIPGVGEERAEAIIRADVLREAEQELRFAEEYKIQILPFNDPRYPSRLRHCQDMPLLVYYRGNADLNCTKVVGVVGTRSISEYGREMTKQFISELEGQDILVVSGLAYGVDIAAHQAALDHKLNTVGVLAHGLNQIYPAQHKPHAKKMVEQGGLLTEYASMEEMHASKFPQRNRIVAGICDAVVVIESAAKGGALITANIANSYNREVYAYPGKATDKYSAGCNFLIRTFKGTMIESGVQFLEAMNWHSPDAKPKKRKQLSLHLSPEEQKIYQLLHESSGMEIDRLVTESGMSGGQIAATLLEMEMTGVIVSLPGKRYKLVGEY